MDTLKLPVFFIFNIYSQLTITYLNTAQTGKIAPDIDSNSISIKNIGRSSWDYNGSYGYEFITQI